MSQFSHSFRDATTGELYDVYHAPETELRNGPRDHRSNRPPSSGGIPTRAVSAPRPRGSGGYYANAFRPRTGGLVPHHGNPAVSMAQATAPAGEFLAIKKSALVDLLPAAGALWASVLSPPDRPAAIGNDVVDRDNASLHREALALHQQNQTRILALTDLAARAARIILD